LHLRVKISEIQRLRGGSPGSRPFQKLLYQCVIGARHMTPTVYQSSAPVARPRLSELSRQVAVDFQSDADFDERRRCPGHGFVPFLGQYRSQWSAYPGGPRIQEIKIIAFVYDPGSGCHPDPSGRPTGTALPSQHADPHDDPAGPRGDPRVSSLLWPGKSSWGPPRSRQRRAGGLLAASFQMPQSRGLPVQIGHALCPFSARPSPTSGLSSKSILSTRSFQDYLEANSPCARSAYLTSARPSKPAKG
jgi:hypothetical protein